MNLLDVVILLLLALSAVNGWRRGAALQVVSYGSLLIGLLLWALLAPRVAALSSDRVVQAVLVLAMLLLLGALAETAGWAVGVRVWTAARRSVLSPVDHGAGSLVAVLAALLVTWFLAFNLVAGPSPRLSSVIRESVVVQTLDAALPRPPSLLAQVRRFLNRFGFPEVFADLPPAPARPVDGPTRPQVVAAFEAADQSTVRVRGEACGRVQEGSGFVVEPGYIVTNAHVVAGVDSPRVEPLGSRGLAAVPVLFDPGLDLAVLHAQTGEIPDLDLLPEDIGRGALGAVLGYPGGGPLRGDGAAVRRGLTALGRDIYGQRTVSREVYELQARIRPGNSGGPFVTPEGAVAGVVFAASTTNDDVGYALKSSQVQGRVRQALGLTDPVDTGPCIR